LEFSPVYGTRRRDKKTAFRASFLFIPHCGTITADIDQAAKRQAKPALASRKHALGFNYGIPSDFVNFLVAETSISSVYPNENSGRAYEGCFDDPFDKCFCPLLTVHIAFGSQESRSYE
jgi:hypothetical protein